MPTTAQQHCRTIEQFSGVRALVIGDAIRDIYHFGRVDRISPEAPVPIFIEDHSKFESRRGGADNVAHQLEALGCKVTTCFASLPSVKSRYMVGHHQVFRTDFDASEEGRNFPWIPGFDVVVLSDYAKGFLTDLMCKAVIAECKAANVPVIVDPKGVDWSKYAGANVICPNEKEWAAVKKIQPEGTDIIAKQGEEGLAVVKRVGGLQEIIQFPARAKRVFDVTGAGDTVVAVIAAALGCVASLEEAAFLANLAAGHVVGEIGTSVCSREKLIELVCE